MAVAMVAVARVAAGWAVMVMEGATEAVARAEGRMVAGKAEAATVVATVVAMVVATVVVTCESPQHQPKARDIAAPRRRARSPHRWQERPPCQSGRCGGPSRIRRGRSAGVWGACRRQLQSTLQVTLLKKATSNFCMHRCPSPLAVVVSLAIFADHPDCPKAVLQDAADRMAAGLIRGYNGCAPCRRFSRNPLRSRGRHTQHFFTHTSVQKSQPRTGH